MPSVLPHSSEAVFGRGEIRQRVLVVGMRGVHALEGPGKSTLLERYLSNHFLPSLPPTQGVASSTKQITLKGRLLTRTLRVEFLELTSDPNQLVALAPIYFNKADAVVFVYDATDRTSFSRLEGLHALVAQHTKPAVHRVSGLLLATKANNNSSKGEKQAVLPAEGLRLAHRLGIPFFDTSAETGINVEVAFNGVIRGTALRVALTYADTGLADAILQQHQQDAPVSPLLTSPPALAFDPPAEEGGGSVSWHDDGFSLLHYAARFDLSEVLQALLLRKGTEVDVVDSRGRTALIVAVLGGYVSCVRLLLKTKGVDVMKVDLAGRTALALAEFKQNAELVTLLTKAQASFLYNEAMMIGAVAPHTCKLALLGSSGSGKTSLWRALRGLPRKDANGRLLRTVLYEVSNTSLSSLEREVDPEEATREEGMLTPHSGEGRQQRGGASSSSTGGIGKKEEEMDDDSEYDSSGGNDHTCSSFTVQLIQTLLGMKGRQEHARKKSSAFEQHPLSSPHLYPQDDAGEVAVTCWDIAAADAAVPLQPALLEHADVVLVCFDLVKATLNQADTLRELTYLFSALDSQEHRPGAPPRAGIVSPARGRGGGEGGQRVFHRRDVLLVGTFLDAVPSIIEGGEGGREGRKAAAVLEELNEAICQRMAHFESFGRLRLPHSPHKPRVFFTVGADDATAAATATAAAATAARNEVGSLRRALCKAVVKNGSLRKSRPSMWMRFLEEVRTAAGGGGGSEGGGGKGAGPMSLEKARQIANQVSFEFTNRPMTPAMFSLMIKLLGEMGEVLLLPRNDVLLTRRDAIFRVYQRLVEQCREMELSPRRRSPGAGKAELQPLLQQLRATGWVGLDDLRLVLGEEVAGGSAHHLTLVLQALEAWDLCLRIQAPSSSSSSSSSTEDGVVVLFPGLPLALNDELFPFPVESPETYTELSGSKVLCYYSFREGRVPQGLLARLLFAGMRSQLHDVGGLCFAYCQWGPPAVLAKDHVEIALNGYTLSLTLDEARARVSCAVRCEEGRVLTRALEAQVGLILYDEMEQLRKGFYPRFKMDLLVVDPLTTMTVTSSSSGGDGAAGKKNGNRAYDFVTDILQAHKAAKASRRAAPDASPSSPRDFQFAAAAASVKGAEEGKEEEEGGRAASYLSRVVHWATVMIAAPSSSFHPLPAALLEAKAEGPSSSSSASPRSPITTEGEQEETWTVHAPLGRLSVILPGPGQSSKPRVLVPHPGGSRRRCKTSAYVCLVDMSSAEAATAAAAGCWCLEAVPGMDKEGFRLRWVVSSLSSSSSGASSSRSSSSEGGGRGMGGWYLGLSSQASEDRHGGTTYVVLNADASHAGVWLCPPSSSSSSLPPSSLNNFIGLQWSKDSYRYLTEGAHDVRLPAARSVILGEEVKQQQQQQQQQRRTWSFLPLEPSELRRATVAPLTAACIAGEEEEGRKGGQSGGTVGALALRVQESEEDTEEGEGGDMNSPEVEETAAAPAAPATTAVVTAKAALADAGREEGKGEEGEDGREDKEEEGEAEEKGADGSPVVARRQAQALTDGAFSLLDDSSM